MSDQDEYLSIDIEQIRPGLYITLDVRWVDHPFLTNTFTIKDEAQVAILKRLGLKTIRYAPGKSRVAPLPPPASPPPPAPPVSPNAEDAAIMAAKQARIERLKRHRQAVLSCERDLLKAASTLKHINQNLFARPQESVQAAQGLVEQMATSLLADSDLAIHAMHDKIAGEDVYYHSLNVAILAMILAKEMQLPEESISLLGLGGVFHDIGKIEVPDKILRKTEPLTPAERNFLAQHPVYGEAIGQRIHLPRPVLDIIRHHHECLDGSGYPDGLRDTAISQLARIVAIVNRYDNLCNHICPEKSLTPYEAISTLFAKERAHFDPTALNVFIRTMGVYPPGTLVQLTNGLWGMVVTVNVRQPLKPSVLVYDPEIPKAEAIILDLDEEPELGIAKTFRANQLPREVFDYLSPRQRVTYYFDHSDKPNKKP